MRLLVALPFLLAPCQDKPPHRYECETLYVIHTKVTAKNYKRIEALLTKAYPKLDLTKLEPLVKDLRDYYRIYRDRLLRQVAPDTDPKLVDLDQGFDIVKDQVQREVRVRGMFWWILSESKRKGSVKAVFDYLVWKDDRKKPICSSKPGKGLLVYRRATGTARQLEDLKDGGVRFGPVFSGWVRRARLKALPAFGDQPSLLGPSGQGRFIFRLLKVHQGPAPKVK